MVLSKDIVMDYETNIKNNMALRIECEYELMLAWDYYYKGDQNIGYIMDLDYYYYENWVEPITQMGPHGLYYLN